ncbi:hypothetical protein [Arthrobacter sp. JSM 101049]|uniref:hypothetical protein n=1 Tax=Arthrobacter sp. JSM 101049 TaxID=929097 RepID=UPI0035665873
MGQLSLAGILLLVAGVAGGLAEIPRWAPCLDELYGPACVAGQEHELYTSVLPGPAWIGEPVAALLQGVALLCIAATIALWSVGRLNTVWRAVLVCSTAGFGMLTVAPALLGHGLAVNTAAEIVLVFAMPLVFLLACLWAGPGGSRPTSRWVLVLLLVAVLMSPLPQVLIGIGITGHHDTPPGYGLVQAVPLAALGAVALIGAAGRVAVRYLRSVFGRGPVVAL